VYTKFNKLIVIYVEKLTKCFQIIWHEDIWWVHTQINFRHSLPHIMINCEIGFFGRLFFFRLPPNHNPNWSDSKAFTIEQVLLQNSVEEVTFLFTAGFSFLVLIPGYPSAIKWGNPWSMELDPPNVRNSIRICLGRCNM